MAEVLEADYLVVGAGAAGMAFTDALIDHADVSVVMVDRRHGVGGHWLDAYPFVRLHQASAFYGVSSTLLGDGGIQPYGPEAGLHERATAPEICAYYARVMRQRMLAYGKVSFHPNCEYLGDGQFVSRLSGKRYEVRGRRRIVDARYLSPQIPAATPPPFAATDGAHVVAVNDLVKLGGASSQYVIAGSGKTATDACIWLLDNGVDPGAICWVRPRDPWMLNRAVVQPDPAVFIGMAADTVQAAAEAASPDDLFYRLEEAGVMLRIDRSVTPTMAKTPTLAQWELDRLRTIEDVVRLGHLQRVEPARLVLSEGEVAVADDAVIVHCAASGLQYRPLVPIWGAEAITLQPIRTGFP
ncbi:MAG: FAD/NAD(P)-binding protein, partial [Actinoplanes sp.]